MSSVRTTRFTSLLTRRAAGGPISTSTRALLQRPICTVSSPPRTNTGTRPVIQIQPSHPISVKIRTLSGLGGTSGKRDADLLVDELQELYEVAKDEFEIATDSTDSATIYAASDRESARDALNQLIATYSLYTSGDIRPTAESHQPQQTQPDDSGTDAVPTNYDPADIKSEAREEVRKRVGQRVRELENAVTLLEERAMED